MTTAHLFPNGKIRSSNRWVPAYSQVLRRGERDPRKPYKPDVALITREYTISQPLTRRDWFAMKEFKCKFHVSQEAAIAALKRGE
jgi:hypothetical protein